MAFTHSAGVAKLHLDNAAGTPIDVSAFVKGYSPETGYETADATTLADLARSFVFGLEDGGETQVEFLLDDAGVVWTLLTGLLRKFSTMTSSPLGTASGKPKMSREVGITKIGTPVQLDDIAKVPVTLKANGATALGAY